LKKGEQTIVQYKDRYQKTKNHDGPQEAAKIAIGAAIPTKGLCWEEGGSWGITDSERKISKGGGRRGFLRVGQGLDTILYTKRWGKLPIAYKLKPIRGKVPRSLE